MSVWDERLITRERAFALAGPWPVYLHLREGRLYLRCGECEQSCARWPLAAGGVSAQLDLDQIVAAVLRHMVMAHDVPLSGASGGRESDETAGGDGRDGAGDLGRGSREHPADPGRGPAGGEGGRR